jgi:hypothetical protein
MSTKNGHGDDKTDGSPVGENPHSCYSTCGLILVVENGRVDLAKAWPLLLFTWLVPILVALKLDSLPICRFDRPWPILIGGGIALALSSAHLGRPARTWRTRLDFRHSWPSREIFALSLFLSLAGILPLLMPPTLPLIPSLAAGLTGLYLLHAVDRIYKIALPLRGPGGIHSAEALVTAVVYTVALRGWGWLFLAALLMKLLLWAPRYLGAGRLALGPLPLLRLGIGLVLPALLLLGGRESTDWLLLAPLLGGELLDRASFYRELRFPSLTPRAGR